SGGGCGGVADEPAGAGPDGVPGVEEGLGRAEALPVGRGGGGLLRGGGFVRGRGGVRAGGWRVRRGGRGLFGGRFGEVFGLVPPPVRQPGRGRAGRLGGVGVEAVPPRVVGGGRRRGGGRAGVRSDAHADEDAADALLVSAGAGHAYPSFGWRRRRSRRTAAATLSRLASGRAAITPRTASALLALLATCSRTRSAMLGRPLSGFVLVAALFAICSRTWFGLLAIVFAVVFACSAF